MAEAFGAATSAAGIISLGITVGQGLYDYYSALADLKSNVAHTTEKLSRLLEILESLRRTIKQRPASTHEDHGLDIVTSSVKSCRDVIEELQEELDKLKSVSRHTLVESLQTKTRRLLYPLRQSTLQKLDEDVDDLVSTLSLAVQAVQQGDVFHIRDDVEDIKALIGSSKVSQETADLKFWLKAPDASLNFNEALKKKHPQTGLWFVQGSVFKQWLEQPTTIWLFGFAGCGKSVLCSTAIQYTLRHRRSNPRIGLAFFYFSFNDETKQGTSALLRALILQLSSQLKNGNAYTSSLRANYVNATPPDAALIACLRQLVRAFSDVYILVDALDESPREKHREDVLQALADMRSWSEHGLHILVTSRDEPDIRESLDLSEESCIRLQNDSHDEDIASFIHQHLRDNRLLRKWNKHYDIIESALTSRAKGVFRWVECQFKALATCPRSGHFLDQLLSSLPPTLNQTYQRILLNIPPICRYDAQRMLAVLCCAREPLTFDELVYYLAVELDGTPRFNPDRQIQDIMSIQEICPGLVEFDTIMEGLIDAEQYTVVRLAHFSVREFLESEQIRDDQQIAQFSVGKEQADAQMASICLTALLNSSTIKERYIKGLPMWETLDRYGPDEYAVRHWLEHYKGGRGSSSVELAMKLILSEEEVCSRSGRFATPLRLPLEWKGPDDSSISAPFWFAASNGLHSVVHDLLQHGYIDIGKSDRLCRSMLNAAAEGGHYETVCVMIDKTVDVNARDHPQQLTNALVRAARHGHDDVVRLLIDNGATVDTRAIEKEGHHGHRTTADIARLGVNALELASRNGHYRTVKLLLDRGAKINGPWDDLDENALYLASEEGHYAIVQLLLDSGANVNAKGGHYGNALEAASVRGHTATVQLLLQSSADVNAEGGYYGNALQAASAWGDHATVQLLLESGADVNAKGGHCGNALQAASENGHIAIVQLLLESGADVNAKGGHCGNALEAASVRGHTATVQLLLESGADINIQGGVFGNALRAAVYCAGGTLKLLKKHGTDLDTREKSYDNMVQMASLICGYRFDQRPVDEGAYSSAQLEECGSVYEMVLKYSNDKTIQLLKSHGAT